jgi:lipopolysaccharide export system ATP-binding protein
MTVSNQMPPPMLSLKGVTARIRDRQILSGTSWTLRTGQSWAVIGPNGAGKSTLAGLLLGTVPAVSGKVVRHVPDARPERIGLVSFELLERLAARETRLDAARHFSGRPWASTRARELLWPSTAETSKKDRHLPEVARRLGVHHLLDRDITALSSGEMRRLLVARALTGRPGLLVFDEPFEGLDTASRRVLRESISEMIREGRMVVLVTHLLENVVPEISHALCVRDGRVVRQGLRRRVITERFVRRLYADRPPPLEPPPISDPVGEKRADRAGPPLVVMKNVCVAYGGSPVVKNVDWTVQPGEHWALLGPNGAGKTTCFYMIVGLIPATEGRILVDDHEITHDPVNKRSALGLSYLPQEASIFRKLSVRQNVMSILELRDDLDREEREDQLQLLLEELGVAHLSDQSGISLSGGERRRVEIARALASRPRFILLDEPFAGVDPISVREIQGIVRHLKDRGIGVLITDHNVRETLGICDHAYILAEGRILAEGTPEDIIENEDVRTVYLGEEFKL